MSNRILVLAAATLLAATASAQFCSDNTYPVHIVDAEGVVLPIGTDPAVSGNASFAPTEDVYMAFDPTMPTGTYYWHVTDANFNGFDEVVSMNDPMDRFVHIENTNGVITLTFPFSSNPANVTLGEGLNGVGESLLINPFRASQYTQCRFKVWCGDVWNLSQGPENPYLLSGGINPLTGGCAVRSFAKFIVGDGSGSDITGLVFNDANSNGMQDEGEDGLEGWTVNLVDGSNMVSVLTDADGFYTFDNIGAASLTVELVVQSGFNVTTSSTHAIETCACAPKHGGDFGVVQASMNCEARTIGYWRNCHGRNLVQQHNILPMLPALCIVNMCGQYVAPSNICQYTGWLQCANSWNMAYMLSAQLVAMHNNVVVGYVDANCVINDPCLGIMTIESLIQQAVASLCAHPFTPPCNSHREHQQKLKNALDSANNNLIWQSAPQPTNSGSGSCQSPKSTSFWRKKRRCGSHH